MLSAMEEIELLQSLDIGDLMNYLSTFTNATQLQLVLVLRKVTSLLKATASEATEAFYALNATKDTCATPNSSALRALNSGRTFSYS